MKHGVLLGVAVTCLALSPGISSAKGCLKGAAVGAVGGHVAGHHGVIGAAAGCAIGHHMANKKDKQKQDAANASTSAPATKQNGSASKSSHS